MKEGLLVAIAAGALTFAFAPLASAQEQPRKPALGRVVPAPERALELGASLQYNQGVGPLSGRTGDTVRNIAGAGLMGELDIGYRFNPYFLLGGYAAGSEFNANDRLPTNARVRGAMLGVQFNYHFSPYKAMDPWIGWGAGYHGLWVVPERGEVTARHGIDFARVQVGADYRVSPELALGPAIGAGATMFLAEKFPGESLSSTPGRRLSFFISAGISGRFDLVGNAVEPAMTSAPTTASASH